MFINRNCKNRENVTFCVYDFQTWLGSRHIICMGLNYKIHPRFPMKSP